MNFFQIYMFHIPFQGSCDSVRSHTTFWPDRFSRFDVYLIQTNKQPDNTDRQTKIILKLDNLMYVNISF